MDFIIGLIIGMLCMGFWAGVKPDILDDFDN